MFGVQVDEEKTCIADSKIPISFKDMFGLPLMFCYELENYISAKQCKSRNSQATCNKFKSIKDFKEENKEK